MSFCLGLGIGFLLGALFWLWALSAMMKRARAAEVAGAMRQREREERVAFLAHYGPSDVERALRGGLLVKGGECRPYDAAWRPVGPGEGARLDAEMDRARGAIAEAVKPVMVTEEDEQAFLAAISGPPQWLLTPEERGDWVNRQRRKLGLEPLEDRLQ